LRDDHPYHVRPSGSEDGAPSWAAASASAASSATLGLWLDHAAAAAPPPARGRPGADIPGAQMPLSELVRQHGTPEVDPDFRADGGVTTMAIVNIPYAYPHWMLQWELNQEGLAYDYFHCPRDTRQERSRGFAFVNFVTPEAADAFYRSFNNRELSYPGAETKVVTVLASRLQGLEANARLHPEGLVLDPQLQLQRHQQRHQQQLRQQQAPSSGSSSRSSNRGAQAAATAAVGRSVTSSSFEGPHTPSRSGNASVICRLSF
jgi:hypothetical protein